MTTTQASEDLYEEVERGIDWLERLENIRARQDREAAMRETVEYVNRLRDAISALSGDTGIQHISEQYGDDIAELVEGIREAGEDDPWLQYLRPALMEH